MSKNSFWFKHDYNARNDEKILELRSEYGVEGYGIYWMLIESMCETSCGGLKASLIGGLSHGFGVAKARLSEIIKFCIEIGLFYDENGTYYSKRLLKHKQERKYLSEMGKIGQEKKKILRGAEGGLKPPLSEESRRDKYIENTLSTNSSKVRLKEKFSKKYEISKNGKENNDSGEGILPRDPNEPNYPPIPY
jgi:hypothetical protein